MEFRDKDKMSESIEEHLARAGNRESKYNDSDYFAPIDEEDVGLSNDAIRSGRILGLVGIPLIALGFYFASVHKYGFEETNDVMRQEFSQMQNLNLYRVFGT